MATFIAAMFNYQQRLYGISVVPVTTVPVVVMPATVSMVVMPAAMTMVVVPVTTMSVIIMPAAGAVILMASAVMPACIVSTGCKHATAFIGRACPVHDRRFHKEQSADRDGVTKKERGNQPPIGSILKRRQMQRRIVIHHRRQNQGNKVHENGTDRRHYQRAQIGNAPCPVKRDNQCKREVDLGESSFEEIHHQIRVIQNVLHQGPQVEKIDTATPRGRAHLSARVPEYRKKLLVADAKERSIPRADGNGVRAPRCTAIKNAIAPRTQSQ